MTEEHRSEPDRPARIHPLPGFQARLPQFGTLIGQIGLDEVEKNLGEYLGMASQ
ncbi:hypothetical protein ACIBJI_13850 [Nocardia sp. NPDC050408]|uniref:hypothetical protein n=1 Tax=unclassified Nocardia TaxID=2637762 RepID=UPI00341E1280